MQEADHSILVETISDITVKAAGLLPVPHSAQRCDELLSKSFKVYAVKKPVCSI